MRLLGNHKAMTVRRLGAGVFEVAEWPEHAMFSTHMLEIDPLIQVDITVRASNGTRCYRVTGADESGGRLFADLLPNGGTGGRNGGEALSGGRFELADEPARPEDDACSAAA